MAKSSTKKTDSSATYGETQSTAALPLPPGEPEAAAAADASSLVPRPASRAPSPAYEERSDAPLRYRIDAPMAEPTAGRYVCRHVDCQLDHRQALALRALSAGLDRQGYRLAGGRRAVTGADAIRWLLEQLAIAVADADAD